MRTNSTTRKSVSVAEAAALNNTAKITVESVLETVAGTKLAAAQALDDVTLKLTQKVVELKDLDLAINARKTELAAVHGIDLSVSNVEEVQAHHTAMMKELEATRLQAEEDWARTQQDRQIADQEYTRNLNLSRAREQDQFELMRDRSRSEAARTEQDERRARERQWAEREALLKGQENDLVTLRARVAGIEEEIRKAVAQATAIEKNRLERDFKHATELAAAQTRASETQFTAQLQNKDSEISRLTAQVGTLTTQLAEAQTAAKEIAKQAVDAAGAHRALTALQSERDADRQQTTRK